MSDPCVFGYNLKEKVPIETYCISSIRNKLVIKVSAQKKGRESYDSYKYVFKFRW